MANNHELASEKRTVKFNAIKHQLTGGNVTNNQLKK